MSRSDTLKPSSFFHRTATRTGGGLRDALGQVGSIGWLAWQVLKHGLLLRTNQVGVVMEQTKLQIRFTALDALPLSLVTALLLGGVTLLQVFSQLSAFGAESALSQLLARLVVREMGPLLVGIIVLARSGTAIAAEMASIQLNGEVSALATLGVNPIQYFLLPRILGGIVSAFCLIVLFDATALLGGFVIAWIKLPLSFSAFLAAMGEALGISELAITAVKALIFGSTIPLICAASGLRVQRSSTEIPQAVTRAAVLTLLTLLLSGAFLSVVFYA